MRILFLSDIHGVPAALDAALAAGAALGYDKIALLGDLLYHIAPAASKCWHMPYGPKSYKREHHHYFQPVSFHRK